MAGNGVAGILNSLIRILTKVSLPATFRGDCNFDRNNFDRTADKRSYLLWNWGFHYSRLYRFLPFTPSFTNSKALSRPKRSP